MHSFLRHAVRQQLLTNVLHHSRAAAEIPFVVNGVMEEMIRYMPAQSGPSSAGFRL